MLHWLPHTSFARIVLGLQTGSSSYVSMHRRYRGKMKEVDLADLSPQACIEILAERMFKVLSPALAPSLFQRFYLTSANAIRKKSGTRNLRSSTLVLQCATLRKQR
eukprot:1798815-Rhodomonas_salina.1